MVNSNSIENSIKTVRQVESDGFKGLGLPLLFVNLSILAGKSVILIGSNGVGKGTVIKSFQAPEQIKRDFTIQLDAPTLIEIATRLGKDASNKDACIQNETILGYTADYATLSKYQKTILFGIFPNIITDGSFFHVLPEKVDGKRIKIDIRNCKAILLLGITPISISRLMSNDSNFNSIGKDRFIKFSMLNGIRDYTNTKGQNEKPNYECKPISEGRDLSKVKIETDFSVSRRLFKGQFSQERTMDYVKSLLSSFAIFEGLDRVTIATEIQFRKLFWPYLTTYPSLLSAYSIEEEARINVGAFRLLEEIHRHNGIELDELLNSFSIYRTIDEAKTDENTNNSNEEQDKMRQSTYDKYINNYMRILHNKNLAIHTKASPHRFNLSPPLVEFWKWYNGGLQ